MGYGRKHERTVEHGVLAELVRFNVVAEAERAGDLCRAVHIPDGFSNIAPLDLRDHEPFAGDDLGWVVHLHSGERHILTAQPGGGKLHRLDDLHIAGAAAVVVLQPLADLLLRRGERPQQKRLRRHDHARRAEAALHRAGIEKRALDDGKNAVVRFVFDRFHALPGERFQKRHARTGELPVDENAARTAMPRRAAFLAALHALDVAQIFQKRHPPLKGRGDLFSIQNKRYGIHGLPLLWIAAFCILFPEKQDNCISSSLFCQPRMRREEVKEARRSRGNGGRERREDSIRRWCSWDDARTGDT